MATTNGSTAIRDKILASLARYRALRIGKFPCAFWRLSSRPGLTADDRKPVPYLAKKVIGKLFGDRGYISKKLTELLATDDVELITTLRKNMKPRVMTAFDAILLRKRSIIETINDQLKNIFQLEHSRHRSLTNYMVNAVACLVAYSYQEKKPALNLRREDLLPLL